MGARKLQQCCSRVALATEVWVGICFHQAPKSENTHQEARPTFTPDMVNLQTGGKKAQSQHQSAGMRVSSTMEMLTVPSLCWRIWQLTIPVQQIMRLLGSSGGRATRT